MLSPLTRRLSNIFVIIFLFFFTFSLYRPINYSALPQFNAKKITSYPNGPSPFALHVPSSVECIPISTTTAFKTTLTESFTTTAVESVATTETISFTVTSVIPQKTQACPVFPDYPSSGQNGPSSGSRTSYDSPALPQGNRSPEQEIIAKLRAEGIVIVFKTGAQELGQLAIQLGTTLRYLSEQDILFFSDEQGSLGPFLINDALRNVDQNLKTSDPDFKIYRDIRKYQQTGQDIQQLNSQKSEGDSRPGWVLDKYKFIHMVEETFEMRPNAKWYVFIETDSYIVLSNLATFLSKLSSTKPLYIGSAVQIGDTAFAHGGSGYVLSNAAMNKLLGPDQPQGLAASWDGKMKEVCCGDLALGTALKEKGVGVTVAHPLMNGYKPTTFTYGPDNHWCQPVVTMHHILPHEVSSMWRFERRREMLGITNATIFSDLYTQFVEPHLIPSRENWDNLSHGREYSQKIQDEGALARKQIADKQRAKAAAEKAKQQKEIELMKEKDEIKRKQREGAKKVEESAPVRFKELKANATRTRQKDLTANFGEKENEKKPGRKPASELIDSSTEPEPTTDEPTSNEPTSNEEDGEEEDVEEIVEEEKTNEEPINETEIEAETETKSESSEADPESNEDGEEEVEEQEGDEVAEGEEANEEPITEAEAESGTSEVDAKSNEGEEGEEKAEEEGDGEKTDNDNVSRSIVVEKKKPELQSRDIIETEDTPTQPSPPNTSFTKRDDPAPPEPEDKTANYTPSEAVAHTSFEACGKVCTEDPACFQWVFFESTCKLGASFRLGQYHAPNEAGDVVFKSGWNVERIRKWTEENACQGPEWPKL